MKKRIIQNSYFYGIIVFLIAIIIESLTLLKFSILYAVSFLIGLCVGIVIFMFNDFTINKLINSEISRPRVYFSFTHIFKMIIYGVFMFLVAKFIGVYKVFTCAFGMLFHKIIIYFTELIKEPYKDKKRLVKELNINKDIETKLINNGFNKVMDITLVTREDLHKFLSEKEAQIVINKLKEYELFIKGELEAIIENDEPVDI